MHLECYYDAMQKYYKFLLFNFYPIKIGQSLMG